MNYAPGNHHPRSSPVNFHTNLPQACNFPTINATNAESLIYAIFGHILKEFT